MAKKLLGPWDVLYPVRFYSGGDTTRQAFGKHIQEIERIYGLLNALDAGKLGSNEIADAIGNITHNGLNGLQGGTAMERYHLTAAQVQKLEGAASGGDIIKEHNSLSGLEGGGGGHFYHLSQAQKNGLDDLIQNGGGGIVDESLSGDGYVVFANGFTVQWGERKFTRSEYQSIVTGRFPIAFRVACWGVVATYSFPHGSAERAHLGIWPEGNAGYSVSLGEFQRDEGGTPRGSVRAFSWIAVGKC